MGFSQHAGMVIVADGTPEAAKRLERVLWNDPGTGVMRHADAGYQIAIDCARGKGASTCRDWRFDSDRAACGRTDGSSLEERCRHHPQARHLSGGCQLGHAGLAGEHRGNPPAWSLLILSGIDRLFAIVEGQVELSIAGRDPLRLTVESSPIAFPGEAEVTSAGIAQALNVMIRRGRYGARATRRSSSTYCRSAVAVVLALKPLAAGYDAQSFRLAANDALMIDDANGKLTMLSAHPDFYLIEIDPLLAQSGS